jgi:hypothetical protein
MTAMSAILEKSRSRGMIAGVHTDGPKTALTRYGEGFHLCSLQTDIRMLLDAARTAVAAVRDGG